MNHRILVFFLVFLVLDFYFYQAVSFLMKNSDSGKRNLIFYVYWGFTGIGVLMVGISLLVPFTEWPKIIRVYVLAIVLLGGIAKLFGSVFILIDDILRLFRWIFTYISPNEDPNPHSVSRIKFLNQMAILMAAIPFTGLIYGMIKSGFDIRVKKVNIKLPNLPMAFQGLKIVQISDIHCGSFTSTKHFENAVAIINDQKPDLIFFTGDLVNDAASETDDFIDTFSKIKAPMGVFSCLGNHDYGDYMQWESAEHKKRNFKKMIDVHQKIGWRLLMNEHVALEKEGEKIAIIGIENWGARGFTKYGDLKKAYSGAENYPVKLLLSHDPSHWEAQVLKEFPGIDAMFSGHTHGMQFGVEIPGFKWSPVQYIYKQWAGLYKKDKQHLYVNRGLGFIGYPGRVGILPEITLIELTS